MWAPLTFFFRQSFIIRLHFLAVKTIKENSHSDEDKLNSFMKIFSTNKIFSVYDLAHFIKCYGFIYIYTYWYCWEKISLKSPWLIPYKQRDAT